MALSPTNVDVLIEVVPQPSVDYYLTVQTTAPGPAGTVAVGTTTTGVPGTSAAVTNTGTPSAAILNFTIPRGDVGATGAAATVAAGTTTTGAPGTSASVTNVGTSSAAVFNFQIPRGDVGAPGSAGTAATISVHSTTTGAPGTSASVVNVGTSSAASLDFVIPRGDTGAPGSAGAAATIAVGTTTTGAAGTSASVTNSGTSSAAVINFTIPRGDVGATGATGIGYGGTSSTSMTVGVGSKTFTTQAGMGYIVGSFIRLVSTSSGSYLYGYITAYSGTSMTVSVVESGGSVGPWTDWKLTVAGRTGDDGPPGNDGTAATIAVGTTTTGAAGSSASVTNSGSSSAAVINFTIPRGDTGTAGAPGSIWYTGAGAPSSGLGVNGDYYLNSTTDDVYLKTTGTWSVVANIKGSTGATGPTGTGGALGYYGEFSDYTTQTVASTTTAYPITLNTTDESNGVSRGSPTSRIVVANGGTYNIQWSGQFENSTSADLDASVWIRKNGTDVAGSRGLISVPGKHGTTDGHAIISWNYVLSLNAGDYIEFYWQAESTSITIPYLPAGTSPVTPSTASVIVTVTQNIYTQLGNLLDGDKGDITVSGSGATWTIDAGVVTTTKMGGDVTASGKALLTSQSANTMVLLKFLE